VFLKVGKIVSVVGNEIVASSHLPAKPLELKNARGMIDMPVYLEDSRKAPFIGKIKNIIGTPQEPFLVISQSKRPNSPKSTDKLINKDIFTP
jgi:rRNA processing protein Gar1